jgi:hypothetical protein
VNLSAEALAAAESGLQRKIAEKRVVLGEGYEQALRLAAGILGDETAAMDTSSQVHWRDVESRSLAQVADALLKLNQLGVPAPVLLKMIPGFTKTRTSRRRRAPIEARRRRRHAAVASPIGMTPAPPPGRRVTWPPPLAAA